MVVAVGVVTALTPAARFPGTRNQSTAPHSDPSRRVERSMTASGGCMVTVALAVMSNRGRVLVHRCARHSAVVRVHKDRCLRDSFVGHPPSGHVKPQPIVNVVYLRCYS